MSLSSIIHAITLLLLLSLLGCERNPEKTAPTEAKVERIEEQPKNEVALYLDDRETISNRVKDLLSRMTTEEKVAQLTALWTGEHYVPNDSILFDTALARQLMPLGTGYMALADSNMQLNAQQQAAYCNAVQKWLREETRLGIPALVYVNGAGGPMLPDATHWNTPIGLASSWNPDLVQKLYAIAARQIRSRGGHILLGPAVDIHQSNNWDAIELTFGEDPFLNASMGKAAVLGLQGADSHYDSTEILATLKHMIGKKVSDADYHYTGERSLRSGPLYPFAYIIHQTDVANVMAGQHIIDGVPSHANSWLFNDLLRQEWGFEGLVLSANSGIKALETEYAVAKDNQEAATTAIESGIDIELPNPITYSTLIAAVNDGLLDEAILNQAVSRVLGQKFRLGLFENPYVDTEKAIANNSLADSLALQAAEEGMILLENDGTLPLSNPDNKKYVLIGPDLATTKYGNVSSNGIKKALDAYITDRGGQLAYSPGLSSELSDREKRKQLLNITRLVRKADIVLLTLGAQDNSNTSLQLQKDLIIALKRLNKPTVALVHGSDLTDINTYANNTNALFLCWHQGQKAGQAITNVLFGEVDASGRLTVSFPDSTGQNITFYNHSRTEKQLAQPLYSFGAGESYTNINIDTVLLSDSIMDSDARVQLDIQLTNIGDRKGKEVIQLYVHDPICAVIRPVKELKDFQKVELDAGESKTISFNIDANTLSFFNKEMQWTTAAGRFKLMVGKSSRDEDLKTVELFLEE